MSSTITSIVPHLHFSGNAAEAIALYERALDAKATARMTWAEAPGAPRAPEEAGKIMHARLEVGRAQLLLADRVAGSPEAAHNGTIMLELTDAAEGARRFAALAEGGRVVMPFEDAFWGAKFGIVEDAVGVMWMVHCATM
jgi:PhnB protein